MRRRRPARSDSLGWFYARSSVPLFAQILSSSTLSRSGWQSCATTRHTHSPQLAARPEERLHRTALARVWNCGEHLIRFQETEINTAGITMHGGPARANELI